MYDGLFANNAIECTIRIFDSMENLCGQKAQEAMGAGEKFGCTIRLK